MVRKCKECKVSACADCSCEGLSPIAQAGCVAGLRRPQEMRACITHTHLPVNTLPRTCRTECRVNTSTALIISDGVTFLSKML